MSNFTNTVRYNIDRMRGKL